MKTGFIPSLLAVMRKELRDISRDRRTLVLALLLGPLLYPVLMLGIGALAENRAKTQLDKVLEVPVVGAEHAPNLVAFLATRGIKAVAAPKDLDTAISRQDVDVALAINPDYGKDWRTGQSAKVEIVADSTRNAARDSGAAPALRAGVLPRSGRHLAPARARGRSDHHAAVEHRQP